MGWQCVLPVADAGIFLIQRSDRYAMCLPIW